MDAEYIRELFSAFGPVQVRRMFGGAGVYADGLMFALVTGGQLYFKTDVEGTKVFAAENCAPFGYDTKTGRRVITSYWRMPDRLYDDADELAEWARAALTCARRKDAEKPASKRTSRRRKKRR